ncbi:MAG: universal stress protein [Acidobacteriota bacterium]
MQRFKNILLVSDGEDRSRAGLERAAALAVRNQAQLTVVSVLESLPRESQRLIAAVHFADLWQIAVDERREGLERFVEGVCAGEVSVTTKILCGTPFLEVIREVLRHQRDLVMMIAEEKGGVKDILFGSTSMHLMRKCPCPVWVMKPGQRRRYARVLAAVDTVPPDEQHNSLNVKIMELGASLARVEGSELHVVHTWVPASERIWGLGSRLRADDREKIARESQQTHGKWFSELLEKSALDDLRVQLHLLRGEASDLIPWLARKKHIDVIVMGTVCRTGVPGLFIGNTAEKVLRQVDCSVLTVKPEGFVTPVTA